MASGYFPLDQLCGKNLARIAEELDAEIMEWREAIALNCTPEDAMDDGGYLERLHMASEFIRYCLEKPAT